MTTTENAKRLLEDLVERLDAKTIAAFCRKRLFASEADLPMHKWSFLNQLFCFMSGTVDARGVIQWREAGRWPKKGSKAIYILVPMFRTDRKVETVQNAETEERTEETKRLSGFRCMPVFRVEDTEGRELDYQRTLRAFDPSKLPLIELAQRMGLTVRADLVNDAYGYFMPSAKAITLGTDDVTTWFHELSHAIDLQLPGHSDDSAFREVVAELSSCFLCTLYGLPHHEQHTKAYIQSYSGNSSVAFELVHAAERVLAIYSFIESFKEEAQKQA